MFNRFKLFATSLLTSVTVRDEEGQAMVEYGIILGLVSVAAIAILAAIGTDITGFFKTIEEAIKGK